MKKEEREMLRERIERKIKRLNEDMVDMLDSTKPISPENSIGRVSRMDAINNKSVSEAALRKAKESLEALGNALQHIEDEKFGLCSRCHEPIQIKRMMLMPESTRCIKCANRI